MWAMALVIDTPGENRRTGELPSLLAPEAREMPTPSSAESMPMVWITSSRSSSRKLEYMPEQPLRDSSIHIIIRRDRPLFTSAASCQGCSGLGFGIFAPVWAAAAASAEGRRDGRR